MTQHAFGERELVAAFVRQPDLGQGRSLDVSLRIAHERELGSFQDQGVQLEAADQDADLTLFKIDDSRCPTQVECVWAGVATAYFLYEKNGQDTIKLSTTDYEAVQTKTQVEHNGYRYRMIEVTPYPETPESIKPEDYRVRIEITKL